MILYVVRHGETEDNITNILQGHLPGKLTKEGIRQAEKIAKRLRHEKFDAIYSSDLKRAVDTAEIITQHHDTPTHYIKNLRERYLGSYQGKKTNEVDWKNIPEEIEKNEDMIERVKNTIIGMHKKHPDSKILFITHGGFSRFINAIMKEIPLEKLYDAKKPKNTSLYIYEINENFEGTVLLENCIKHLE
jgi:broad specificity phosphatase PhoE